MQKGLTINASTRICVGTALGLVGGAVATAAPGDHIRSGNTEVVPSIQLMAEYRTNVYLQEGAVSNGPPTQDGTSIRVRPELTVNVDGSHVIFDFSAGYTARKYLVAEQANLDRFKDVDLGTSINALHSAPVGLKLSDRFHIIGRETEATYATSAYIGHTSNDAQGRLSVHPGGAMDLDLGGYHTYDHYEVAPNVAPSGSPALNSRAGYGPAVDLKWRFFPKTAIIATYSMAWFDWENNLLDAQGEGINEGEVGAFLGVPDGSSWRATLGMRGRFTEKIVLGIIGGYGRMTYDTASVTGGGGESDASSQGFGQNLDEFPDSLLVTVELGYSPIETQTITLGYRKAFQDVYFTNFVVFHNSFLRYEGMFADRFGMRLEGAVRAEDYSGEISRSDLVMRGGLDLTYRTTPFLDLDIGTGWIRRVSADGANPEIEYDDVAVRAGLTFTY